MTQAERITELEQILRNVAIPIISRYRVETPVMHHSYELANAGALALIKLKGVLHE